MQANRIENANLAIGMANRQDHSVRSKPDDAAFCAIVGPNDFCRYSARRCLAPALLLLIAAPALAQELGAAPSYKRPKRQRRQRQRSGRKKTSPPAEPSRQTIQLDGRTVSYQVTVGTLPVYNDGNEKRRSGLHRPTPMDGRNVRHFALTSATAPLPSVLEPWPRSVPSIFNPARRGQPLGSRAPAG